MKPLAIALFVFTTLCCNAQPILFSKCYGGPGNEDRCFSTIDAPPGVIMSGRTNSNGGDVTGFHGSTDGWVVKTNAVGGVDWTKSYGGGGEETIMRSILTADGNILHVGFSGGVGGDVTSNFGSTDYWVIKTDMLGNIIWQKSYGGTHEDCAYDAVDLGDGTYMVCGISHSGDSMVTNHYGLVTTRDVWMIKVSATDGHLIWERTYGGTGNESIVSNYKYFRLMSMINYDATSVAFTIGSNSADGDVGSPVPNSGEYWLVKLDTSGAILFEETYGGTQIDMSYDLVKAPDNGFAIIGASLSNDGDVTGHHGTQLGMYDYWVMKTDPVGNLQWQRSCGGGNYEDGFSICATALGFYILGRSESLDADCAASGWHGGTDYWVAYLDYNGVLMWDKDMGGSGFEEGYEVLVTSDGKLTCGGHAGSNDDDVLGQHGGFDFWLVKLNDVTGINDPVGNNAAFSLYPNPGYDRVYIKSKETATRVEIYDEAGRLTRNCSVTEGMIDCSGLETGVYAFLFYTDDAIIGSCRWVRQ